MNKFTLTILVLFAALQVYGQISPSQSNNKRGEQQTVLAQYLAIISKDSIMQHLATLSSNAYEGRGTFERGNEKTAEYLIQYFKKHGNPEFRASIAAIIADNHLNIAPDYTYSNKKHADQLYYRSDHYNFAKNGVPICFFNSMADPNYHQPTDDYQYIEPEALHEVAKLVFATIFTQANPIAKK